MDYKEKIEEKRQKLVNTLIEFIENNPTQWEAGWYKVATEPPFNGKSEKAYKGLNAFYLCVLSMLKGYRDPRWVTFKQAKELGGNVKSGEKSSEIFYWSFYDKATKKPYEEKTCEGMTKKERLEYWEKNVRPVIKFYQVFNAEQCENLPEYKRETTPEMEAEERQRQNAVIEQIIANSDAPVNYDGGNRAYYSPAEDSIHLPEIKDFKTMQDYYATALHEIAHSTGHESRLNRNLLGFFGTADYAKEELRAELASVFMQVEYGISIEGRHFENHGAYLAGWLKSVKDNKNEFYAAATDAEKITGYIADNYLNAKSESKEQQQTTPKFEANTSFAKQVDAVLSGADTTSTHLKIMGTPLILRQLGAQNIPVLMTAKHLKNIVAESGDEKNVNYHGIDVDLIKKLPELLSDPVMVMDSLTRDDSVVIVTSAVDKENRPIIGAIKFDGFGNDDGEKISANILLSVYGRNHFNEFIQHNLNENTVLYWDKEKSQELIEIPGVQFPDSLNSLTTNTIIRKAKAFVNSLGEKNENIPVVEAKKAEKRDAKTEQAEQVGQVQQAENTKEKYILEFQLNYSYELLLSKELEKFGYKVDLSAAIDNQERDAAAYEANLPYWVNEIRYTDQDGKVISGLYGKVNNDILIEKTDITQFTLDGFNRKEAEEVAKVLSGFDIDVTLKQAETAEQSEQAQQADTAEQVKQVRQVGQAKWQKITIEPTLIGAERGKSTMLRMPEGEYSSFVLFVPTKFIEQDEKSGSVQLSVNDNFNYSLMKGNQRVELSGSELCQAMAGKEVGKRTQRVLSEANAENLTNIYRNIPEEMRQYPNWCVYRTRWNEEKGKYDKQIYSPVLGLNKDGKMQWASVDKPETWATFDVAMKFAEDNDCAGLVFALDGKTGISCIDLDKAIVKDGKLNNKPTDRADGEMSALALRLSNELKNTYIETSASGNGLHIFVKDDLLAKGRYKNRVETPDGEIEVYDDKRFMSMTGKLRSNTQRLNKCPVATTAFLQSQLGEKTALQTAQPRQSRQVDNSDNAVIERIRRSKRGTEFDALYRGEDLTGDNSRNDFKMLNMLAFFTDCDESQMERIFKSSALYRAEKSDAYVQHSVKKACATLQTRMSNRAYYGGNKKSGNNGNSK